MQPRIGQWNCFALGQAMLPLVGSVEDTEAALAGYEAVFEARQEQLLHAKLGLATVRPEDEQLIDAMFAILRENRVDFTLFFRRLGELRVGEPQADEPIRDLIIDRPAFDAWAVQYRARLQAEGSDDGRRRLAMHAVNPKYVLRNYLAQVAIEKAQQRDFSEVAKLQAILRRPYDEQPEHEQYAELPPGWASHLEVSCSS
jgi:uncharacterized protein YdiU (UPF0061 family)